VGSLLSRRRLGHRRCRLPPAALRQVPSSQVFLGPFAGDEHHQVRPPLVFPSRLAKPSTQILTIRGRIWSNYKCICMYYAYWLQIFCKIIGFTCLPMSFTGSAPGPWFYGSWKMARIPSLKSLNAFPHAEEHLLKKTYSGAVGMVYGDPIVL
jgi:hypothetical protein